MRVWVVILLLLPCFVWGQVNRPYDKNSWKLPLDTLKKVRFVFFFDDRFSLLHGAPVQFTGIKTGVQVGRYWRTGVGFFFNRKEQTVEHTTSDKFPGLVLRAQTRFYYGTLFAEFIALRKVRWEITIPMHLGFGGAVTRYFDETTRAHLGYRSNFIVLSEVTPTVSFRFCRWVGVGAGIGYRFIFTRNKDLRKAYDAPIVMLRVKFYVYELLRLVQKEAAKNRGNRSVYRTLQ